MINGYRDWDSLDSVFMTMGPNPLAMSPEVGPTVARSYHHQTSMLKELIPKLPPTHSIPDEQLNMELIAQLYQEDPRKVQEILRPVLCKDPHEIAQLKDMSWCPDPPVYAPLYAMHEEDKETLRLACYDPAQNASLVFADVNTTYNIKEDVWGVMAEYKNWQSLATAKPEARYRRVKDDCIMA